MRIRDKDLTVPVRLTYMERVRCYENDKKNVLQMCKTKDEVERALYLLRKKWRL